MKPIVLVIGPTGQIGKLLTENLRNKNSIELRVASRKKEQLPELSKRYEKAVS